MQIIQLILQATHRASLGMPAIQAGFCHPFVKWDLIQGIAFAARLLLSRTSLTTCLHCWAMALKVAHALLEQDVYLATTGVLPSTLAFHRTSRGSSTSRPVAAAFRITSIKATLLALGVLGL